MGRSKGARKKAGQAARIKPWHSIYVRLHLPGLIVGVIPKRIRAIEGAKERLKTARTVRAAAVEWRHIDTNLSAIDSAYSKIRTALRDGGDMHRWTEFPGLEAAVNQVNDITWSDLQGRGIPGRTVKFNLPKFDDSPLTSNTRVIKSDDLPAGPIRNREPVQTHIKNEFEDELEDGEIKDAIKEETEDEQGVSLDIGPPKPHEDGDSYEAGFGDRSPGSRLQSMPQSSVSHPGHDRVYWHSQPIFTPFYAVIPYYSIDFPSSGPDDFIRGNPDTQPPYGASHPQLHAFPPRLGDSRHPMIQPPAFRPSPSSPRPRHPTPSSNLPKEPPRAKMPPSTSSLEPAIANQPESEQRDKRKLATSTDTCTAITGRPPKRRRPVASDFMSDDEQPQYSRSKHTLPANGLSDFGTWFQERVTGSKKKLSHLEHVSAPTGNRKGS